MVRTVRPGTAICPRILPVCFDVSAIYSRPVSW